MQLRVQLNAALHVGQWYLRDLVLNATTSSLACEYAGVEGIHIAMTALAMIDARTSLPSIREHSVLPGGS